MSKKPVGKWVPSGPIKGWKPMTDRQKVRRLRGWITANMVHRPFSFKNGKGNPKKDYYRGQWDAMVGVLEDILGEEL